MTSKEKLIGIALIVIGLAFIALGVWAGMPRKITNNPGIYTEQNINNVENNQVNTLNNNVNDSIYQEPVNEDSEEGTTRYIY